MNLRVSRRKRAEREWVTHRRERGKNCKSKETLSARVLGGLKNKSAFIGHQSSHQSCFSLPLEVVSYTIPALWLVALRVPWFLPAHLSSLIGATCLPPAPPMWSQPWSLIGAASSAVTNGLTTVKGGASLKTCRRLHRRFAASPVCVFMHWADCYFAFDFQSSWGLFVWLFFFCFDVLFFTLQELFAPIMRHFTYSPLFFLFKTSWRQLKSSQFQGPVFHFPQQERRGIKCVWVQQSQRNTPDLSYLTAVDTCASVDFKEFPCVPERKCFVFLSTKISEPSRNTSGPISRVT